MCRMRRGRWRACLEAETSAVSGEIFNVGSASLNLQIEQLGAAIARVVPGTEIVRVENADRTELSRLVREDRESFEFSMRADVGVGDRRNLCGDSVGADCRFYDRAVQQSDGDAGDGCGCRRDARSDGPTQHAGARGGEASLRIFLARETRLKFGNLLTSGLPFRTSRCLSNGLSRTDKKRDARHVEFRGRIVWLAPDFVQT